MVLGFIEFLLGGKKKTPQNKPAATERQVEPQPTSQDTSTENKPTESVTQPQDSSFKSEDRPLNISGKSAITDALQRIHKELKSTNERVTEVVGSLKKIENDVNNLGHRVDDLEESKKQSEERMGDMDNNMSKFLSLYELINNQYNPFVSEEEMVLQKSQPQTVELDASGNSLNDPLSSNDMSQKTYKEVSLPSSENNHSSRKKREQASLLELDTLNIEEAAGDAVPLTRLKGNTNSLVTILSWLEYLVDRVGIEETRNTLRYYTEVLRWITPEVFFDLDKYLRGMKDKDDLEDGMKLAVKDHIVSLYFISKLNEKTLDDKLVRAVLNIIND